jgi:enoyl-CoA hydratase/carnithine racemase
LSEEKPVLVKKEDGVCWISLNRPDKLNTIIPKMLDLISEALDNAEDDPSVRCIVIKGTGDRAFCAGADVSFLKKLSSSEAKEVSKKGHKTFMKIQNISKPVVAAVDGYALGGGCELAAACDFRIASDKALLGQPEVNLGLIPGWGGTQLLPKLVGVTKAKEIILTGKILSAEEALEAGLINKVLAVDNYEEELKNFITSLVKSPPLAVGEAKKLINIGLASEVGLNAEAEAFSGLFSTKDFEEGISAFSEKRKPIFKGK